MPDICMCKNRNCKHNLSCYRYMAIPSDLQSYFGGDYVNEECRFFVEIEQGDNIRDNPDIKDIQ